MPQLPSASSAQPSGPRIRPPRVITVEKNTASPQMTRVAGPQRLTHLARHVRTMLLSGIVLQITPSHKPESLEESPHRNTALPPDDLTEAHHLAYNTPHSRRGAIGEGMNGSHCISPL